MFLKELFCLGGAESLVGYAWSLVRVLSTCRYLWSHGPSGGG